MVKNAAALVIGSDGQQKSQLIESLIDTGLFSKVTPLNNISAILQYLSTSPADVICWAIENSVPDVEWVTKLREQDQWYDLPLIAFAADQKSLLHAYDLGVCDSMHLETDPLEFSARLQSHLKRWQRLCSLHHDQQQLQKLALTDFLTGLGNRATFDINIKSAVARSKRYGEELSLLMIDLDHFKKFNDCYGHQTGDEVLKMVAAAIKEAARESDSCCRFGGEEFTVILPQTSANNARAVASRIHKNIAKVSRKQWQDGLPITVSIGISSMRAEEPVDLIQTADCALYQAKAAGRDRTETWQPISTAWVARKNHFVMGKQQLAFVV